MPRLTSAPHQVKDDDPVSHPIAVQCLSQTESFRALISSQTGIGGRATQSGCVDASICGHQHSLINLGLASCSSCSHVTTGECSSCETSFCKSESAQNGRGSRCQCVGRISRLVVGRVLVFQCSRGVGGYRTVIRWWRCSYVSLLMSDPPNGLTGSIPGGD